MEDKTDFDFKQTMREIMQAHQIGLQEMREIRREFQEQVQENRRQDEENRKRFEENRRQDEENRKRFEENRRQDEENRKRFEEIADGFKETRKQFEEIAMQSKETDKQFKETDKKIKELSKNIGGIGERFGSFTEGFAFNSMQKILTRDFKADHIFPNSRIYNANKEVIAEYDVLSWCNSTVNTVVIVEVKTTLKMDYIKKFEDSLNKFKIINPDIAKDKKVYGILAFVGNFDKNLQDYCHSQGIYTATIHDEIFKLNKKQEKFIAKNFND